MSESDSGRGRSARRGTTLSNSREPALENSDQARPGKRPRMKEECMICSIDIEKCKHLGCTMCDGYVCQKCSLVTEALFDALMNDEMPGFNWICKSCNKDLPSMKNISTKLDQRMDALEDKIDGMEDRITQKIKAVIPEIVKKEVDQVGKNIERQVEKKLKRMETIVAEKMDEKVHEMDDKIEAIKSCLEEKNDEAKQLVKDEIEREMTKNQGAIAKAVARFQGEGTPQRGTPVSPNTQMKMTVASVAKEIQDKEERRNNFIVYNLEEPKTNLKNERIKQDKETMLKVISDTLEVEIDVTNILEATRLGKDKIEGKKRPLLVIMSEEQTKNKSSANWLN